MSSASQLLFGSIQGENFFAPEPEMPDLSELIIEDAPLVYWKLEGNGSSGETDYSGNGFTAGNVTYIPVSAIRGGLSTQAGFFGMDTGERVGDSTPPRPSLVSETSWTLEAVVQIDDSPAIGNFYGFLFGAFEDAQNGVHAYSIYLETPDTGGANKQLRVRTDLGGSSYIQAAPNIGAGPLHVVGVRDGSSLSIYVDGNLINQRNDLPSASVPNTESHPYGIAAPAFTSSYSLDFTICDVAAYDYALSPERILAHYNGAKI